MKLNDWLNKFKKKSIPIEYSQHDELDDFEMNVINSRIRWVDRWTTKYSKDGVEFAICFFQLYKGCEWYEFVCTAKHAELKFYGSTCYLTAYENIKEIKIEGLEEYAYSKGTQFTLCNNDKEYICTIEHIIYDRINNKIFFKLKIKK